MRSAVSSSATAVSSPCSLLRPTRPAYRNSVTLCDITQHRYEKRRRGMTMANDTDSSRIRSAEELGARALEAPSLVGLGRPASLTGEEVPDVGVVDRPEDVGRTVDVECGIESLLCM